MKPETQMVLEGVTQYDTLLYDTTTFIAAGHAWKALACEDASLRGKKAEEFAHWLRQRALLPQAGEYTPFPTRPRERQALYRLADLLAVLEQLPSLREQFAATIKRRAAAKAAHPRAATVQAARTRQASETALASFDTEALGLLARLRALGYPRAAAVRAVQQTARPRLLALLERVETGVQTGTMYQPAAYLAAALEDR